MPRLTSASTPCFDKAAVQRTALARLLHSSAGRGRTRSQRERVVDVALPQPAPLPTPLPIARTTGYVRARSVGCSLCSAPTEPTLIATRRPAGRLPRPVPHRRLADRLLPRPPAPQTISTRPKTRGEQRAHAAGASSRRSGRVSAQSARQKHTPEFIPPTHDQASDPVNDFPFFTCPVALTVPVPPKPWPAVGAASEPTLCRSSQQPSPESDTGKTPCLVRPAHRSPFRSLTYHKFNGTLSSDSTTPH